MNIVDEEKLVFDELDSDKPSGGKGSIGFGGIRGKYSKRLFDPENAGGPILNLNWENAKITLKGMDIVKKHLSRFEDVLANRKMIQRLKKILDGEIEATDWDKRFYTHEIREFERYKALGFEDTLQKDIIDNHKVWNDTHTATLEDYKLSGKDVEGVNNLYHPDIIEIDFISDIDRELLGL